MVKVDLRTITLNVPPQEVITKDNVPVRVNAVAYFRIVDPKAAIVQVENFMVATSQIAQTTLRSVLGQHLLDELLSERDKINAILQEIIDEATAPWGIKVSIVEVKDVEIPAGMQRAMARQAEAERERRAKVIAAEGEFQASERLKDAALVMEEHADRAAAPLPADAARARAVGVDDDRLPGADRPVQAVPREEPPGPGHLSGSSATTRSRAGWSWSRRAARSGRARAGRTLEPPTPEELDACPFCAGREDRTPPETLARSATSRWRVRVVPNLYPAFERQEVVVHSPRARALARRARRRAGRARRGGVATAARRPSPPATCTRSSTRAARRARASRTRTRSSSGSREPAARVTAEHGEPRPRTTSSPSAAGLVATCPCAGRRALRAR